MAPADNPGFVSRFFMAFGVFFRVWFDGAFASGVKRLGSGEPAPTPAPEPEPAPKPESKVAQAKPDAAYQLLALLQREGRFVDFVQEDVANFSDAEIGAAARVVHEGARKAIGEHFTVEPVKSENEGATIKIESGFDANAIKLTGNVVGEPPFEGTLQHRGWRVARSNLPAISDKHDTSVIAPAEVEL